MSEADTLEITLIDSVTNTEMVLSYTIHPERFECHSRHQYVLDMTRDDVIDYFRGV